MNLISKTCERSEYTIIILLEYSIITYFFLRLQILFSPKSKRRVVGKYEREDNHYFTFPLKTNVKFFFSYIIRL